jgi:CRISPR/Cas system-associated exonuclease Cas4 (RecB family)
LEEVAGIYRKEDNSAKSEVFNQLYRESIFRAYTTLNRFATLIEEGSLKVQRETFRRLLVKVLSSTNIPFHGEPAIGMQIMGVLETRNLDFKHLILLSVNEGQLPKTGGDSSFIPYNLRKAFGMTTIDHKISVYAYYFYRLLQRAEKVTLMYNNSSDGLNRGEWSRFMLQYLIESNQPIIQQSLVAGQSPQGSTAIRIPKTPQVIERMHRVYDLASNKKAMLSPSALNNYLDCPLKFYLKYVAGLQVPEEVSAEIDSATFGSIFHKCAENIYKDLTAHGNWITKEELEKLAKDTIRLEAYVDEAFKELFFHIPADEKPEYNGTQLINSAVIVRYLKQLLKQDIRYAPFQYVESEKSVAEEVTIHTPAGDFRSRIGGYIDRLDSKDDTLRIVDYKTGGSPDTPPSVESLFIPDKKRSNYVFQTFLYAAIMSRQQNLKVAPSLLYIHRAASEDYSPVICLKEGRNEAETVTDFSIYEDEFREGLQKLLDEIFHPEVDFTQTEVEEKCAYCDFKAFCRK